MVRLRRIPMRRLGIASIAIASLTNPVAAADLPVKAPPAVFLPFTWTGPYACAFGGYGWSTSGGLHAEGGFGGGPIGYNLQPGTLPLGIARGLASDALSQRVMLSARP